MTLSAPLTHQVTPTVRDKGRSYFENGAVHILEGDEGWVYAEVQGGRSYDVSLRRDRRKLKVTCSCPYFDENFDTCKHIWATLLAADANGYLRRPGEKTGPTCLDPEVDDEYFDDDAVDEFRGAWEEDELPPRDVRLSPPGGRSVQKLRGKASKARSWKRQLATLRDAVREPIGHPRDAWPVGREIVYVVDLPDSDSDGLILQIAYRERKKDGNWSKLKSQRVSEAQLPELPDARDRQILSLLSGAKEQSPYGYGYSSYYESAACRYTLSAPLHEPLLPRLCQTGRCFLRRSDDKDDLQVIQWDDGEPWGLCLAAALDEAGKNYLITGELRRGEERLPLQAPLMLVQGGLVFHEDRVARLDDHGSFEWISLLQQNGTLRVPIAQAKELLEELLSLPRLPRLELPEELQFEEVAPPPRCRLTVKKEQQRYGTDWLRGELAFDYDGVPIIHQQRGVGVYQADRRRFVRRDPQQERAAVERLHRAGFHLRTYYGSEPILQLAPRHLPRVVRELLAEDWHVEAEGKLFRRAGAFRIEVSSGIDWFELHGEVQFGETAVALPELLAAIRKGETTVKLGDGTFGMLPEEWLKKYGLLAGLGKPQDDHLRFARAQVGLLDALLAAQPEASCDAAFRKARDELRRFEGIAPADAPAGFVGQLREYQRDGLGWLHFLQRFGFGGCLADDMGLGKTVQVLALLEARRRRRREASNGKRNGERRPPSLVVVPRSLVFNWKQEAARFTPHLRVLDHTGVERQQPGRHFADHDVVLTTYGTLRRDAADLKDFRFDYCILDEAQAIKNAGSESAKAARLLQADQRLALSGTPIENHLGELWSLFEFLNPGMLGTASVFRLGAGRNPDPQTRELLARALRPFLLRRTKERVARDLPEKAEQTLYCELEPAQRKLYDQLRAHYRRALLDRIEKVGLNRAKIQVLEALLRLRQAACHPGLIDKKRTSDSSAKLDMLLPQLAEVLDEGHKALVFSQFTQFLSIVRDRLDKEGVPYEYLDGRTRDRQTKVERFQNDPDCKLFLISLKAGGLGLNLTAAEYVFLLDPWWNPAVEAQAIDRAHRIGQTRSVFAYRLIARDTVEEKVLELQKTKRNLADAIVNADNSLIRELQREDLELLLS